MNPCWRKSAALISAYVALEILYYLSQYFELEYISLTTNLDSNKLVLVTNLWKYLI